MKSRKRRGPTLYWYLFKHPLAKVYRNRILYFIALVAVLGGAYFLVTSLKPDRLANENRATQSSSSGEKDIAEYSFEEVLNSPDIEFQLEYIKFLRENLLQLSLTAQVVRLQQTVAIAEKLLHSTITSEAQQDIATAALLDGLTLMDVLNMANEMNQDLHRRKVRELARQHIDDENINIRRKAALGLALVSASDYIMDTSAVKLDFLKKQLASATDMIGDDPISLVSLEKIGDILFANVEIEPALQIYQLLFDKISAKQISEKSKAVAKLVTNNLANKVAFIDISYTTIVSEIGIGNFDVVTEINKFIDRMNGRPLITALNYERAIQLVELLYQTPLSNRIPSMIDRLEQAAGQLKYDDNRERALQLVNAFKRRSDAIGKKVELNGKGLRGEELAQLENRVVLIAFFGTQTTKSLESLYSVADMGYLVQKGVSFLCVTKDSDQEIINQAADSLRSGIFVYGDEAKKIFDQFPVDQVPYFLILDRNHRVMKINPASHQLRKWLEQALDSADDSVSGR